jgi:hypothetical protein
MSFIKDLKIGLTQSLENLPSPFFAKSRETRDSLWQREVGRDFRNRCIYYYETVDHLSSRNVLRRVVKEETYFERY